MTTTYKGFKYSLKPFEGYTHRHKVQITKFTYFNGPYSTDIYTDNSDKEEVLRTLNKSEFVGWNPGAVLTIVHTATRQEDEADSEFLDEFLAGI